MLTKDNFPQSLAVDLEVAYKEGREEVGSNVMYNNIIRIVPTTSNAKQEVFYGDKGRLRRFRGERQPKAFYEYKQNMTLDDWEYTISVKRTVLDDDQSGGVLRNKVKNFGRVIESSLEAETFEFLHNGTSIIGFDGKQLFHKFHTYKDSNGVDHGQTQSNLHMGGSQLDATILQLEMAHYAELTSDTGKPIGMKLTDIFVKRGSANAKSARELSNSQFTVEASTVKGTMTTNVFSGAFTLNEFDYGFGNTEWFSADLSDPETKPVIVLSHSVSPGFNNLEYTQQLEDSYTGFMRNEFLFGVFGRFDWNPGDWRCINLHGSSAYTFTPSDSSSQRALYPNV
jgi:phage major head subunit gpT-like protein